MSKSPPEILIIDNDDVDDDPNNDNEDNEVAILTKDMIKDPSSAMIINNNDHEKGGGKVNTTTEVGIATSPILMLDQDQKRQDENMNNNNNMNDDDEDEYDQQPITHLPQPNYESQFRATIIKPLYSILDSNTQEETLTMVRMQLFVVFQGLYLEAKSIYSNESTLKNTNFIPKDVLTAPGLYTQNNDNVYGFNMIDCTFADPDAESVTKQKLLPTVIKMLLKLGVDGGDRKCRYNDTSCCLSVIAEDLVVSILLDFVGMVSNIFSLVNCRFDGNIDADDNGNGNESREFDTTTNNDDVVDDNVDISLSNKRRKIEKSEDDNNVKCVPSIIDYIGVEILSTFSRLLASESCYAGYNQSLRLLRQEDRNQDVTVDDVVHIYLPPFFKSHLFDDMAMKEGMLIDDSNHGGNGISTLMSESMKDEYLSPLRSGEWKDYLVLYHTNDLVQGTTLMSKDSTTTFETRDAPPGSSAPTISRHLIAIARYFVSCNGLDNLNKIMTLGSPFFTKEQELNGLMISSVDVTHLPIFISIFRSISFVSSYYVTGTSTGSDCIEKSSTMNSLMHFRSTLKQYLESFISDAMKLSQEEHRCVLDILGSLEERSLTEDECIHLNQDLIQTSISPYLDFSMTDSVLMKLSFLWKLFTGQDIDDLEIGSQSVSPSLQCQILALNDIVSWLKSLDNTMQESKKHYVDLCGKDDRNKFSERADSPNILINGIEKKHPTAVPDSSHCDSTGINPGFQNDALSDVENNDNQSTEVCYNSNDSLSSTNSEIKVTSKYEKVGDDDILNRCESEFSSRLALSLQFVQAAEYRLFRVLDMLKTECNILSHLFTSDGLHTELLKRCLPLIEIFVTNKRLRQEDLKMIWDVTGFSSCENTVNLHVHGSLSSAVFDLILALLDNHWMSLGRQLVFYLGGLCLEVRDDQWTRQSLYLVEAVVQRSLDLINYESLSSQEQHHLTKKVPVGIDVLWRLAQEDFLIDNEGPRNDLVNNAFGALLRIFENVMTKCINPVNGFDNGQNLRDMTSDDQGQSQIEWIQTYIIKRAITSMECPSQLLNRTSNVRILHYLLMHLPLTVTTTKQQDNLLSVEDIFESYDLLSIVTDEMVAYEEDNKQKLDDAKKNGLPKVENVICVGNVYMHKECVFHRQQLFQMIVAKIIYLMDLGTDLKSKETNNEGIVHRHAIMVDEENKIIDLQPKESSKTLWLPTEVHISKLWKSYIHNRMACNTTDCIIDMFYFIMTTMDPLSSSPEILEGRHLMIKVLYPLCCQLHVASMTESGYKLLVYCIGNMNAIEGKFELLHHDSTTDQNITKQLQVMSQILLGLSISFDLTNNFGRSLVTKILSYKITGLETQWSIILEANDENVAKMAMLYIAILYCFPQNNDVGNYKSNLLGNDNGEASFVQQCIAELQQNDINDLRFRRQTRILSLVKLFVQYTMMHSSTFHETIFSHGHLSEKMNSLQVENIIGVSKSLTVRIEVLNGPKFNVSCPLGKNTKTSFLHESIKNHPSYNSQEDFRLVFEGCELKYGTKSFEECRIESNSLIYCCPRLSTKHLKSNNPIHVVEPLVESKDTRDMIDEDKILNERIGKITEVQDNDYVSSGYSHNGLSELLSEKCIETLFSLLTSSSDRNKVGNTSRKRELVWDLLQLLPTETILQEDLDSLFSTKSNNQQKKSTLRKWLPIPSLNGDKHCEMFKLLYCLQVVERIIYKIDCKTDERTGIDMKDSIIIDGNNIAEVDESNAVVVIDEDDDDDGLHSSKRHGSANERNGCTNEHENSLSVQNFLLHGGLEHLVDMFIALSDVYFHIPNNSIDHDHESSTLAVTCANKLVFLICSLVTQHKNMCHDDRISLVTFGECSPLFTQLLKTIHWSIIFQLDSSNDHSKISKYITGGGWSSSEIGGALALQCITLMKIMSPVMHKDDSIQFIKPKDPKILSDAMSSSIVISPSKVVRSKSLPVFKQLISLYEKEHKKPLFSEKISVKSSISYHSPFLSTLVALLPVGRKYALRGNGTYGEVSSRSFILFELVTSYISNTWSQLSAEDKQKVISVFIKQANSISQSAFSSAVLSGPPMIEGMDEISTLFVWLVHEFKVLINAKEQDEFCPYISGILSLARSIIVLFSTNELDTIIGDVKITSSQNFLQFMFESATYCIESCNGRERHRLTTQTLRKQIMDIIKILCTNSEKNIELIFHLIKSCLYSFTPRVDLVKEWSFDPALKTKSSTGHVGLKNQGATCYLNSLLQLFFHTPQLRLGLLSCNTETARNKDASEQEQLLFELQRVFGNLLISEKRDVRTSDLTKYIRGYDGNPIRPGEQQDVDEFFNLFCDRLETALKSYPQKRLLHDVFGGQLSHIITCQECQYSSERIEDFLSISLDVKGKHDIFESLTSYIRGEVLDGSNKYFCSKCQMKRDSIKRCCLKTLPNVLICHLKRFDFDLEMLRKVKVNDHFSYPTHLNMKKFTKEGIGGTADLDGLQWRGDEYYSYTLRGVLVHSGTADSGHYYSLCHVRNYDPEATQEQTLDEGSWCCFNDSIVSSFDPSTLEVSTFGGSYESSETSLGQAKRYDSNKSYNAYLLIYDRKDRYAFDQQLDKNPEKLQINPSAVNLGMSWAKNIPSENLRNAMDQIIFSPEYCSFIIDLCNFALSDTRSELIYVSNQVLTLHLLDNLVHVKDRSEEIDKLFSILLSRYEQCEKSCYWLLKSLSSSHKHWVEKLFLHCYKPLVRINFVNLLCVVFHKVTPLERNIYYELVPIATGGVEVMSEDAFDADGDTIVYSIKTPGSRRNLQRLPYWRSKSTLVLFVGALLNIIDVHRDDCRHFENIFECLAKLACCGQDEAVLLIRCGVILRLVDIYQGEKGNIPENLLIRPPNVSTIAEKDKPKTNNRNNRSNCLSLLQLLSILTRSGSFADEKDFDVSDSDSSIEEQVDSIQQTNNSNLNDNFLTNNCVSTRDDQGLLYELPKRDSFFVSQRVIFELMLNEFFGSAAHNGSEIICQIICHICFNDFDKTMIICALAQRIIKDKKADESAIAVNVLVALVHVHDKHLKQRIKVATTSIFEGIKANSEFETELMSLLSTVHNELINRTPKLRGSENEVYFHQILVENLDRFISLLGQNISIYVKNKILAIMKALLPLPSSLPNFRTDYSLSEKSIVLAHSGFSLDALGMQTSGDNQVGSKPLSESPGSLGMQNYVDESLIKDKLFVAMKDLYMTVSDAIYTQCSEDREKTVSRSVLNHSYFIRSSLFYDYFVVLRECLSDPEYQNRLNKFTDSNWIHDITAYLVPVLWEIDSCGRCQFRSPADILKGEMIRFFTRLEVIDPGQFIDAFLKHSGGNSCSNDHIVKLLEIFVTSSDNCVYNDLYMTDYYDLVAFMAKKNDTIYEEVINHDNWQWALRSFLLNKNITRRGFLYETLLHHTTDFVYKDSRFRRKMFSNLVPSDNDESLELSAVPAALNLLTNIFEAENRLDTKDIKKKPCINKFLSFNYGGMSKISTIMKEGFVQLCTSCEAEGQTVELEAMEKVDFCLQCMTQLLGSLHVNQINILMRENWPEVDEINSLCTQIITLYDEEWEQYEPFLNSAFADPMYKLAGDLQQLLVRASSTNQEVMEID